MPEQSLPVGPGPPRPRKKGKQSKVAKPVTIAHDIDTKSRTVDVLSSENKDRDFASLMLSDPVLRGLKESGFVRPSPIQLAAIPNGKIGLDMIVQSKSGTGKTCVFVVVALEMVRSELPGLQVLVLAPTREIAMQGVEVASQIGSCLPEVKISSFIGGMPVAEDRIKAQHCHMAVGTPGRLKQMLKERILNPDTVRLVILDEADKLLEPSFIADTTHILNLLPQNKQVLALSATYPEELSALAEKFMRAPQHIRLGKENQVLHGAMQFVMQLEQSPSQQKQTQIKHTALLKIVSSVPYNQCLIFSNFQVIAQSTADFLNNRGYPSVFISAGEDQARRNQVIQTFKTFKCRILCSTDLTARGIDAENVNLVINLDVPADHNTYLHRIGRGGRFGSKSISISLAPQGKETTRLKKIVTLTGSSIRILPAIMPSDIRSEDLPTLEGLSAEELDEANQKNDKDGEKIDKEKPDETDKTDKPERKGNKIKRRGKKSAKPEPEEKTKEKIAITNINFEEELNRIIAFKPDCFKEVKSYDEVCDIARSIETSSLILKDKITQDNVEKTREIGKHFKTYIENQDERFLTQLSLAEKHLGYRQLTDVLAQIKTNNAPVEEYMENKPSEISEISESESSLSHESFSSDDEEEVTSDAGSLPQSIQPLPSNPSPYLTNILSAPTLPPRSCEAHLAPERLRELQRWYNNVERQRRVIQNREYWSVREYLTRRN